MGSGDVHGLGLAIEASEGEVGAEVWATAAAELARLEGVARQYALPGLGSTFVHFEDTAGSWVAHEMRVDANGRLAIKTRASLDFAFLLSIQSQLQLHANALLLLTNGNLINPPTYFLSSSSCLYSPAYGPFLAGG